MSMRPFSKALAAAVGPLWILCACTMPVPNDAEIGCAYDPQSSPKCPGFDAGAHLSDASSPVEASSDAGSSDAVAADGAVSSGLGNACSGPSDCAAQSASYCLVSPSGTFASFCTLTHCTTAACGASYVCCDCTMSPLSQVNTFPPGVCVLPMTAKALPAYGCTCASN
jgi:hypothetical protein